MLISPRPFQVQFAVAQQHLPQLCMGGKDAKLSLRDQTSTTAYHRGIFGVGKWDSSGAKQKPNFGLRSGELSCKSRLCLAFDPFGIYRFGL